ncbi:MAG: ABC transporter permease [Bacteroidetes bacterium]|nr:ABC transporter permease [bacterium]NBP63250.1 ABC transporter permease [Bacteroidota bacterium]
MNEMKTMSKSVAVFRKEIAIEFRSRIALSALFLFMVITISSIAFTTAGERMNNYVASALLWIVLFFGSMTGLSRTFVMEEERGTSLLLKLSSSPIEIFFGKLLFTTSLSLTLSFLGAGLFLFFLPNVIVGNLMFFWLMICILSICMASAITAIAAIIAKANGKGALFPVLSFPVLLPPALLGVEGLSMAMYGAPMSEAISTIIVLIAYTGIMIAVSSLLFEFIWND